APSGRAAPEHRSWESACRSHSTRSGCRRPDHPLLLRVHEGPIAGTRGRAASAPQLDASSMIFSSVDFFVFFLVFLLLYRVLPHREQNVLILLGSYVFYSWWDWRFTGLIVLMSLVDAIAAIEIGKTEVVARRKLWVAASFTVNLGVLGFFKYFNFFIDTAAQIIQSMGFQPHLTTLRLILPVGVSFFTFQSMSYVL